MKGRLIIRTLMLLVAAVVVFASCTSYRAAGRSGKVPPGQAKKIYGQQSARDFAPGHNR